MQLYASLCNAIENIRRKYVSPGIIIMGDFNKWKHANLFESASTIVQSVDFSTFFDDQRNNNSKLDLIFSNWWYDKHDGMINQFHMQH